jgi:hypothetical protein
MSRAGDIPMLQATENWLVQVDYDLATAEHMLHAGRYIYVVFMCHLALEKMLKALEKELQRRRFGSPVRPDSALKGRRNGTLPFRWRAGVGAFRARLSAPALTLTLSQRERGVSQRAARISASNLPEKA